MAVALRGFWLLAVLLHWVCVSHARRMRHMGKKEWVKWKSLIERKPRKQKQNLLIAVRGVPERGSYCRLIILTFRIGLGKSFDSLVKRKVKKDAEHTILAIWISYNNMERVPTRALTRDITLSHKSAAGLLPGPLRLGSGSCLPSGVFCH